MTEPKVRANFLGVGTDLSVRVVQLRPHRSTPPLLGFQLARLRATDSHAHHTRTRAHTQKQRGTQALLQRKRFSTKEDDDDVDHSLQVHTLAHAHSTRHSADLLGCLRERSRRAVAG